MGSCCLATDALLCVLLPSLASWFANKRLPDCCLPCEQFEKACKEVLKEDHQLTNEGEEQEFDDVQVLLYSSQHFGPSGMRQLTSTRVSQLVQISGIITSASKPKVGQGLGPDQFHCWQLHTTLQQMAVAPSGREGCWLLVD
jgi:hypothetical protein